MKRPRLDPWLACRGLHVLGLTLGLLAGCATGAKLDSAPVHAAAPAPAPAPVTWGRDGDLAVGPLLWQVESRDGPALFLFGTMHTETAASIRPEVWARFRTARTVAFETDVTAFTGPAMMAKALLPRTSRSTRWSGPRPGPGSATTSRPPFRSRRSRASGPGSSRASCWCRPAG